VKKIKKIKIKFEFGFYILKKKVESSRRLLNFVFLGKKNGEIDKNLAKIFYEI